MNYPYSVVSSRTSALAAGLLLVLAPIAGFAAPASLDATFGAGVVTTRFDGYGDFVSGEALQSDGKIVVAGTAGESGGGSDFALLRYNANGTLDKSFNGTGKVTTAFLDGGKVSYATANAVAIQTNGAIVVAGVAGSPEGNIALARYNPNGSLDTTFGNCGKVVTIYGLEGSDALAVALQADGKIIVAGYYYEELDDTAYFVARYNSNGSLDTTFGGTGIVAKNFDASYDYAQSVAVQPDGKIVVTGTISPARNQYSIATLRYNVNGTLDTTFNGSGVVMTGFNFQEGEGESVCIQTDGKILVGGGGPGTSSFDFAVARYNANGSVDTSFNGSGKVTVNLGSFQGEDDVDIAYSVAVQGDGKIILAGETDPPHGKSFGVVRLNTNGSLDTTFNGTGQVLTAAGYDYGAAYAVVSGTTIVVSGTGFDGAKNMFMTVRYTASGALDPTFHPSGGATVPAGSGYESEPIVSNDSANAVAIAAGGKILLAGNDFNGISNEFALARLNADGSRDTTFNGTGKVFTDIGEDDKDDLANAIAVQADGKILVAGTSSNGSNDDFAVARYNTDGSLDTTFHSTGAVTTDLSGGNDEGAGVAVQADGKIVVAGTAQSGGRNVFAAVRYNTDGSLDPTFGGAGKVLTSIGTGNSFGKGLALQADGKILVAGYAYGTGNYDFALVRYNPNGSLDTNFVLQGKDTTAIGHRDDLGQGVAVQPDGKILVAGVSYTDTISVSTLVRYNSNGSLDTSFNPSGHTGTISVAVGPRDYAGGSVALQPDGKIVLAGTATNGSASLIALQRYTASGVPDTDFNGTGQVTTAFNSGAFGNGVALQPDGKIIVGGATSNGVYDNFAAVRYVGGQ